jgi:hypothetical protein
MRRTVGVSYSVTFQKIIVLCIVCFVTFYVLFVCKCVLYYCHRVTTQLQLTNISYHIIVLTSKEHIWSVLWMYTFDIVKHCTIQLTRLI